MFYDHDTHGDYMNTIKLSAISIIALISTTAFASSYQETLRNKETVLSFYETAINNRDYDAAEKYMGPYYKQHNPIAEDGKQGFKKYLNYMHDTYPNAHSDIKRVAAEGDLVFLHVHAVKVPNTRGQAVVDIFRLENGKIVEHWDAIQDVPEKSANENGMF
jgi:predicted SnoaL-like aldol condensation-catalyzing enzyme